MLCPYCRKKIDIKLLAQHFAAAGGKKSRRKLTREDAIKMVMIRKQKRKDNND